jgi:sulfopyruvate decarboxylase subunit alpha
MGMHKSREAATKFFALQGDRQAMNPSLTIYRGLKHAGIDFVISVPCVNLQKLLDLVGKDPEIIHVPVTREEEGAGLCAGAWMAGRRPALLMQNSGLGNCINALASLDILYGIPLLMIISHRGGAGEPIVGQVPMGRLTAPLLDAMEIPHFSPTCDEAEDKVNDAWSLAAAGRKPVAVLLDLDFWRGA